MTGKSGTRRASGADGGEGGLRARDILRLRGNGEGSDGDVTLVGAKKPMCTKRNGQGNAKPTSGDTWM